MSTTLNKLEPHLCPDDDNKPIYERRLTIKPILYPTVWKWYKKQEAKHWTADHFTGSIIGDSEDINLLSPREEKTLKSVLAFFAASDEIVNMNLEKNFIDKITMKEAQYFYREQAKMEGVHSEVYSILVETYAKNDKEKNKLLNAVATIPSIRAKANWAMKWINSKASLGELLVAFIGVEGIQFSGSFCFIYNIKKLYQGKFKGLITSNDYIATDECIHRDFNIFLYLTYLQNKLSQNRVHEILGSAVDVEVEFIRDMIPDGLLGMSTESMIQYIKFTTDSILYKMNLEPLYKVKNPYSWMEEQGLDGSTNFFERMVTEYNNPGLDWDEDDYQLTDDIFE